MFTRVIVLAIFSLCVSSVHGQVVVGNILNKDNPFIKNETDLTRWEPDGDRFPSHFSNRGYVEAHTRSGEFVYGYTPTVRVGSFLIQSATLAADYRYTINLSSYHPISVHSPFSHTATANFASQAKDELTETNINLAWDALMKHPDDGYDGAPGGAYARDEFSFDIDGFASQQKFSPKKKENRNKTTNKNYVQKRLEDIRETVTEKISDSIEMLELPLNLTKEQHYSRNLANVMPTTEETAIKLGWTRLPDPKAVYHQIGKGHQDNTKYVSPRGGHHEAVYNNGRLIIADHNKGAYVSVNKKGYKVVKSEANIGTYNIYGPNNRLYRKRIPCFI
uniref:Uncharacterized protein n=1 Tax=Candidatus Kentrum sp. UNK TaxID=2126344 RepID=A0A451AQY0_9GAMM|nr:MAG: Protein of unknown function (DUF1020) [Candidatus Kentron sp. UNK]VFK68439.1 MAG: Protein of unknown function (DUF1020) [Candidatus Kentron sp. UNK]